MAAWLFFPGSLVSRELQYKWGEGELARGESSQQQHPPLEPGLGEQWAGAGPGMEFHPAAKGGRESPASAGHSQEAAQKPAHPNADRHLSPSLSLWLSHTHAFTPFPLLLLDHPPPVPLASSSFSAPTACPCSCPPSGGPPGSHPTPACIASAGCRETGGVKKSHQQRKRSPEGSEIEQIRDGYCELTSP